MRKPHIATAGLVLALTTAALAQQKAFTGPGTNWHVGGNWQGQSVPGLSDDVLIPNGFTVIVSSGTALARSVEVEYGADLQVNNGLTLQIRTPSSHAYPSMEIDGEVIFTGVSGSPPDYATLQLEMPDDGVAEILGDGLLTGAELAEWATHGSTYAIDRVHAIGVVVQGNWSIPLNVENDGTFVVADYDTMTFYDPSDFASAVGGGGAFVAEAGSGLVFQRVDFNGAQPFDGILTATGSGALVWIDHADDWAAATVTAENAGVVYVYDGIFADGTTITVTSGGLLYSQDWGYVALNNATLCIDDGGEATFEEDMFASNGSQITIGDDGSLVAYLDVDWQDTTVLLTGEATVDVDGQLALTQDSSLTIDDDASVTAFSVYASTSGDITVQTDSNVGAAIECETLFTSQADFVLTSGLVDVIGATSDSQFYLSTATLSGGVLRFGGGYGAADSGTSWTISGGTLDIRDTFISQGPLSWTGGTIKLAEGKTADFVRDAPEP